VKAPLAGIEIDILQLPETDTGFRYVLSIIDVFTNYVRILPMKDKEANTVAHLLLTHWINLFGVPQTIISDQGTEFVNSTISYITKALHIEHIFASAKHPQTTGRVERLNKTIIQYCRKFLNGNNTWDTITPFIEMAYNSARHSTNKVAPFSALFLSDMRLPLSQIVSQRPSYSDEYGPEMINELCKTFKQVTNEKRKEFLSQKKQFDKAARERKFAVGDRVYLKTGPLKPKHVKIQSHWRGPYVIMKLLPFDNVQIKENFTAKIISVHVNRLKHVPHFEFQIDEPPTRDTSNNPPVAIENEPRRSRRLQNLPATDM